MTARLTILQIYESKVYRLSTMEYEVGDGSTGVQVLETLKGYQILDYPVINRVVKSPETKEKIKIKVKSTVW